MHDEGFHGTDIWERPEEGAASDIEGIERFTLRSVGIDIGSSTTHAIFSRLILRREGGALSSRFVVTSREEIYRSPIMLTPYYSSGTMIDTAMVRDFIESSYEDAGFTPEDIDTGAVVITGEALKKENAQPILEYFSAGSGRFICASAGPMHEALLAAHGSGAVNVSRHHNNAVLNVDIGGGTSKISLIRGGRIAQMAAVEVGARLIAFDDDMTILRLEQPARTIMKALGYAVEIGGALTQEQCRAFVGKMTDILFDVIGGGDLDPLTQSLVLGEGLKDHSLEQVDHIVFSGGVSEYIYGRSSVGHGDFGLALGAAVLERTEAAFKPGALIRATTGIRATVIGAGEYTLQASGSTSYISSVDVLPVRGIKVAHVAISKAQSLDDMTDALTKALKKYDLERLDENTVLSLTLEGQPDYPYIRRVAQSIVGVADPARSRGEPLFLVLDVDVAKSLGGILREEFGLNRAVIAIDGIEVGDLDYVDIGTPLGATDIIPVTVKSLVFAIRSASG